MNISMFDILGPIMIGPSSSHTAGAQRIGKAMYNMIADKQLQAVHFILHGSFHLTLRGHGHRPRAGRRRAGNERL